MRTAYRFRIYPSQKQTYKLDETLEICRHLYNNALAERRDAWKNEQKSVSYFDQAASLTSEKKSDPRLRSVFSQVLQDVLRRLDKAFTAFFRRVKSGDKPGYPRFKGAGWYKSFTYPQAGFKLDNGRLNLSKIGSVRIFKHREIEGKIKTCTLKKDAVGDWLAILVAENEDVPTIEPETAIGVDVGLKTLAATSAGELIGYPDYLHTEEKKLAKSQRELSRKKKGSNNRAKAKLKVAKIHRKITRRRDDYLHKVSRHLTDSADMVVFENLNIQGMVKNHHLAKSIADHSWGKLIRFTQSKAAKVGKVVELVDARYTSQICSNCGIIVPKTLAQRVHRCSKCGLEMDRDVNAAINIMNRSTLGQRGRACGDIL
ncbi:MAG: RNA-guided endonuclease InsQ/TnpB family protein [Methanotrichaceae archaeon]